MAAVVKTPVTFGNLTEIEDEDDLFEIDLEAVNNTPPPGYQWGSYRTDNPGIALFANCLLPVADVSSAIPAAPVTAMSDVSAQSIRTRRRDCLSVPEPVPPRKLLHLPYSKSPVNCLQEMPGTDATRDGR